MYPKGPSTPCYRTWGPFRSMNNHTYGTDCLQTQGLAIIWVYIKTLVVSITKRTKASRYIGFRPFN